MVNGKSARKIPPYTSTGTKNCDIVLKSFLKINLELEIIISSKLDDLTMLLF